MDVNMDVKDLQTQHFEMIINIYMKFITSKIY